MQGRDVTGAMHLFLFQMAISGPLESELQWRAEQVAEALGAPAASIEVRLKAAVAARTRHLEEAGVSYEQETFRQRVIAFEAFKLQTYVQGGVFPKRYFGYFDEQGPTAPHEIAMRRATRCAVDVINEHQRTNDSPLRITDAEVAITFIAEGGALWLGDQYDKVNDLHPVMDVGLDDIALGLQSHPTLLKNLDRSCGSRLSTLVVTTAPDDPVPARAWARVNARPGQHAWLVERMRFTDAVVGTALMWVWEKEIAASKHKERGTLAVHRRNPAQQFITGSLVYNSGIAHAESTISMIETLDTGGYLANRRRANASKGLLNVAHPPQLLAEVNAGRDYRDQWTSWNAAYHVMQRYGAWEAIRRFTDVFDDKGRYTVRPNR
jgi:hypothetical protein